MLNALNTHNGRSEAHDFDKLGPNIISVIYTTPFKISAIHNILAQNKFDHF